MKAVTNWDPFTTGIAIPESGRWDPFRDTGLDLFSGFFAPVARRYPVAGTPTDVVACQWAS